MIKALKNLLIRPDAVSSEATSNETQAHVAAALLIEVMVIDGHIDKQEEQTIKLLLTQQFNITEDAVGQLFENAYQQVKESTSLFEFTHAVNKQFSVVQKFQFVENLWKIAYADGNLDKYEEHIIRRISDLIHLPHSQFIHAKNTARTQ